MRVRERENKLWGDNESWVGDIGRERMDCRKGRKNFVVDWGKGG